MIALREHPSNGILICTYDINLLGVFAAESMEMLRGGPADLPGNFYIFIPSSISITSTTHIKTTANCNMKSHVFKHKLRVSRTYTIHITCV